ncbi:MAG: alpha/beta hydrolase [Alcanivorax sp.]|uniref:Alpha/beta hydrolase n=1 Tax=Alloalcanivorax marinus TaxID=1177169 RepID=A0A9Q3UQY3_9GAMM|nr:alpha/beta hydrolase [Alloalcanivorax marinus]MBM7334404.1 alpha/beta hydrolase [Alloalcanivorax marinus]MCC4309969.1 alpha/beta hydrolase [Alloalcanivorax marinus]MCU5788442.1 putative alpha/beta hydrolase fold protein [Alloalcanivorax marinus]
MSSTRLYGANVHANGIRQHYLRYGGKGQPLVLIPGITSPAITWEFVAERLGRNFDTYVLDVRGRGLSSTGPDLDYGTDTCADDVVGFVEALGLDDYILAGHSMGARFALRAVTRGAKGVAKLALIDPPVSGPGRREYPSKLPWYVDSINDCTHGAGLETMRKYCPTWTEEQLLLRAEWLHTCYLPAIVKSFEEFHEVDIHQDFPKVQIPTLLMCAGKGGVIQDEDKDEIKQLLPSIRIETVPDAGHMIPWDDLEGFFQGFGDFLGARP